MPNIKTGGTNSRTPFYKFFDIHQLNQRTSTREFDYSPCREISTAKYVTWIAPDKDFGQFSSAILSNDPRGKSEPPLNLNSDGKPLKFNSALKSSNVLYWERADIEEWCRHFDTTTGRAVHKFKKN
jgi:hypothetical protein